MNRLILIIFTIAFLGFSCVNQKPKSQEELQAEAKEINDGYTTSGTRNYTGSADEVKNTGNNMSLDLYLKGLAGVLVTGAGMSSRVTVRGENSFSSDTEPLFVINSNPISGGFSTAYQMINVNDIKSVSVLKDAASTGIYGVRGSNGVIVITLKK
jgi:TonB-dependent starch-binding outer membrane protein SusC